MTTTRPTLTAAGREVTGKAVGRLRRAGRLPAVLFGRGVQSRSVSVDAHEFELLRKHVLRTTLVDLRVDGGAPEPVLVHGVQVHPVTGRPLHVDLFAVKMTEELTVDVPIVLAGAAPAVEKLGGTLVHGVDAIRVRALPDRLPQTFEVSIDGLVDFDATIHVRDLVIPPGATLLSDPDEQVAHVVAPRIEEVAPAAPEAAAAEAPEGAPAEAPREATASEGQAGPER